MINLTCIVLNYNDAITTLELISKIKKFDIIDKIIIVDNMSTDDSYKTLSNNQDSKIILIQSENNGGYGSGNNIGIRYAYNVLKSKYVLIANPDIIIEEAVIKKLIDDMIAECNAGLVAATMLNSNNIPINTGWKIPSFFEYVMATSAIMNFLFNPIRFVNSTNCGIIEVGCVTGACFLARTDRLFNYGLFDEEIFLYCEETVLGIKMKKNNQLVLIDTDVSFIHNHSVSINKSIKKESDRYSVYLQSKEKVLKKYYKFNKPACLIAFFFLKYCKVENLAINMLRKLK